MNKTYDINVEEFMPLISPNDLKQELPMGQTSCDTVINGRKGIERILKKEDKRLLAVVGPCSINDPAAALEYAERLRDLSAKVSETIMIVMRVYFDKPRTTVGWKGLINDPYLDGSCDMTEGLRKARKLLLDITEMGLPAGTEMLDPITPQYIAGMISWAAIGARTTESQTHRQMSSGLSMAVGFKNCTDGSLTKAIDAITAASSPQSFLGIDPEGKASVVKTTGNPFTHVVMRGGTRPNYDTVSIADAITDLRAKNQPELLMIDCSHANSRKKHEGQRIVWNDVLKQRMDGNDALVGMMLESHLKEGNQKMTANPADLAYGVSITDACISWETTEELLLSANESLLASGVCRS